MMGMGAVEFGIFILMFMMSGGFGVPVGFAPGEEDPYLSQVAPEECVLYASWAGAKAVDENANPTEKWLAQKEVQSTLMKLRSEANRLGKSFEESDSESGPFQALTMKLPELLLTRPSCAYVDEVEWGDNFSEAPEFSGLFMINLGDRLEEIKTDFEGLGQAFLDEYKMKPMKFEGEDFYKGFFKELDLNVEFGIFEKYLVVALASDTMNSPLEGLSKNAKTAEPKWLSELKEELPVSRRASVSMVNVASMESAFDGFVFPDIGQVFETLGKDEIKNIGWVTGVDEDGFIARTTAHCPKEPKGLLSVFDCPPFTKDQLKSIPASVDFAGATRLSTERLYRLIEKIADQMGGRQDFDQSVGQFEAFSGLTLKDDILDNLDDYFYLYGELDMIAPTDPWLLAIGIKDEMGFLDTLENLNTRIQELSDEGNGTEFNKKEHNGIELFTLTLPQQGFFGGPSEVSWTQSDSQLLITLNEEKLKQHLDGLANGKSLIDSKGYQQMSVVAKEIGVEGPIAMLHFDMVPFLEQLLPFLNMIGDSRPHPSFDFTAKDIPPVNVVVNGLEPNMTGLFRTEKGFQMYHRQTIPGGSPTATFGLGMGLTLPFSQLDRLDRGRRESKNNIRQLSLSILNFESTNRRLPASYSSDKDGNPLLSWRVHVLPFLGHGDLYDEFRQDEPWDSDHNAKLIASMPDVFQHPEIDLEVGKTLYLGITGKSGALGDPEKGKRTGNRIANITDGTSNTIILVEAAQDHAVTWTQPSDFNPDELEKIIDHLKGNWKTGHIIYGNVDGSIHEVIADKATQMKERMTRNGGEIIDWNQLPTPVPTP